MSAVRARLATKGVAAGIVARDRRGDALVVETSYRAQWGVPGGLVENGEGLVAATRRELDEDLGLMLPAATCSSSTAARPCRLSVGRARHRVAVLDGGEHDDDAIESSTFLNGEIVQAPWAYDALLDRCGARLSTRVRAGLAALRGGRLPKRYYSARP